ncbi:hypothetical protein CDD82_6976 [Ophiocordyceps australis]|uniref:DNL-type domain-containing protein n=1 Tax=Ophiocordyceps australis TaxID=1399860 RepID=A0A2C5XXT7_9HYPO|nr:hypothetical protein CDD82_6976 [Ophiocordyceps australis]
MASSASNARFASLCRLRACPVSPKRPYQANSSVACFSSWQRPRRLIPPASRFPHCRHAHSIPRPSPPAPRSVGPNAEPAAEGVTSQGPRPEIKDPAYYQLSFTCVPCGHRSHHNVSKQAYHTGSCLITCPGCRNRHVISDHLGIFGKRGVTVEELMREKGNLVKRGSLGEDGDIEFWPDEGEAKDASTKS